MRAPARIRTSSKSKMPANPRDYDRRKKRGTVRKTGRPMWRQPLLLGIAVLLLGMGGGGGWWAWHEGWLAEAERRVDAAMLSFVGAITPFKLADVTVEGRDYVEREAILAALNVKLGDSLLGIDLQAARQRLEAIDWVASATVERRLPDTLYVTLKERRAVAIWQNGDVFTLIDRNGRTVRASRMPPGAETLLLLGGPFLYQATWGSKSASTVQPEQQPAAAAKVEPTRAVEPTLLRERTALRPNALSSIPRRPPCPVATSPVRPRSPL